MTIGPAGHVKRLFVCMYLKQAAISHSAPFGSTSTRSLLSRALSGGPLQFITDYEHRPAVPFFLRNSREVWAGVGPVGVMANVLQTVTNWCSLPKNFILLPHRVVSLISPQVLKPFVPSLLLSNVNIFRLHCCDLE